MKPLIIGLLFLLLSFSSVSAQGVFDTVATPSATASPSATPRAVTYLDTSNTPTSGAIENTIALLLGGSALIYMGIRFSRT